MSRVYYQISEKTKADNSFEQAVSRISNTTRQVHFLIQNKRPFTIVAQY